MRGGRQPLSAAASEARWVAVAPERLAGWLLRFGERHGVTAWDPGPEWVTLSAADGARAECLVPFPPLAVRQEAADGGLQEHAAAERTVGVFLVRLGGYAAGIFVGASLQSSRVGSRPVHGRNAAGGWSQKRFARRREAQVAVAMGAAAQAAVHVLVPALDRLDAVVLGGDRHALSSALADPRLVGLAPLLASAILDIPNPNRRVLESAYVRFRAVRIRVIEDVARR